MSIVPRPRHRADSADAGFGLPELLVSMTVFSIVIAAMTAVFVNTIDSVRFVCIRKMSPSRLWERASM